MSPPSHGANPPRDLLTCMQAQTHDTHTQTHTFSHLQTCDTGSYSRTHTCANKFTDTYLQTQYTDTGHRI